jgi:Domain of unknown function (DUF4943)
MIMKNKLFFLLAVLCTITSCKDEFDMRNPNVDRFVSLLKDGSYINKVGHELPDFRIEHIERLLFYSKDTSVVSFFPSNPISSKQTYPKVLSECILWAIDGIRLERKYPSLEPRLKDTLAYNPTMGFPRLTGKELLKISDIYSKWYNDYKDSPSDSLKKQNLLGNTGYKWD